MQATITQFGCGWNNLENQFSDDMESDSRLVFCGLGPAQGSNT